MGQIPHDVNRGVRACHVPLLLIVRRTMGPNPRPAVVRVHAKSRKTNQHQPIPLPINPCLGQEKCPNACPNAKLVSKKLWLYCSPKLSSPAESLVKPKLLIPKLRLIANPKETTNLLPLPSAGLQQYVLALTSTFFGSV